MTARDDLHALTGAYALGALDAHETAPFEAYLAESEEARMEVAELTATAILLGMATRPVTPPAALKLRIMGELLNTPQLGSLISGDADGQAPTLRSVAPIGAPAPSAPGRVVAPDVVPSADEHRRIRHVARSSAKSRARWFGRPTGILIAAAAAVGLFVAGSAVGASVGSQPQDSQAASFTELYAAADLEQQMASVAGGGEATLLWSDGLERAAVVITDLPALTEEQTYELWFIDGGTVTSAGTLDAVDSGATLRVLDGQLTDNASIGLTVEPAGGSEKPTTDPIVVIDSA